MPRPRTSNDAALVLPAGRSQSLEAQTFPGFPGVYVPGEPVGLSKLGLTVAEANTAIAEMGLPLMQTKSDDNEGVPDGDNS